MTLRSHRRLGAWLIATLLACGSKRAADSTTVIRTDPDGGGSPLPTPTTPELDAGRSPASPGADASAAPVGIADDDVASESGVSPSDVLGQRVLELLEAHCATCLDDPDGPGVAAVSISRLIEGGQIVPGSSERSPVFQSIQLSPYPQGDPRRPPTAGELALIARFIDGLAASVPDCAPLPFVSVDRALALMAADSQSLELAQRPFTRYVTLTDASNAQLCGPALERQRQALFEAVNGASLAPDIRLPQAVDADALIYRLDVRDYAWSRALDVDDDGTVDFDDGWQAAVASAAAYGVAYTGPEADDLAAALATSVPFLSARVLVHAVTTGDLYYSLTGVRRAVADTMLELGVDVITALGENTPQLAAFGGRGREVRVLRLPQAEDSRAWWAIEDSNPSDSSSQYEDPIDFYEAPPAAIFHLPNGLQAYVIETGEGRRANSVVPHRYCGSCDADEALALAACPACHGGGLLPIVDDIRAYVERNPINYDPETFAAVQAQYPTADELDALLNQDSNVHRAALAQTLVPAVGSDPLSRVYFQFERGSLDLRRAAGELGVVPETLAALIPALDPRLAPLQSGMTVDRVTFTSAFKASLCVLQADARNRVADCP